MLVLLPSLFLSDPKPDRHIPEVVHQLQLFFLSCVSFMSNIQSLLTGT